YTKRHERVLISISLRSNKRPVPRPGRRRSASCWREENRDRRHAKCRFHVQPSAPVHRSRSNVIDPRREHAVHTLFPASRSIEKRCSPLPQAAVAAVWRRAARRYSIVLFPCLRYEVSTITVRGWICRSLLIFLVTHPLTRMVLTSSCSKQARFSAAAADLSCPAVLFEKPAVRCAKLSQTILATIRKHRRRPAKEPGYRRLPASLPDVTHAARPEERQRSPQRLLLLSRSQSSSVPVSCRQSARLLIASCLL